MLNQKIDFNNQAGKNKKLREQEHRRSRMWLKLAVENQEAMKKIASVNSKIQAIQSEANRIVRMLQNEIKGRQHRNNNDNWFKFKFGNALKALFKATDEEWNAPDKFVCEIEISPTPEFSRAMFSQEINWIYLPITTGRNKIDDNTKGILFHELKHVVQNVLQTLIRDDDYSLDYDPKTLGSVLGYVNGYFFNQSEIEATAARIYLEWKSGADLKTGFKQEVDRIRFPFRMFANQQSSIQAIVDQLEDRYSNALKRELKKTYPLIKDLI